MIAGEQRLLEVSANPLTDGRETIQSHNDINLVKSMEGVACMNLSRNSCHYMELKTF
jgi:hypothetical protein